MSVTVAPENLVTRTDTHTLALTTDRRNGCIQVLCLHRVMFNREDQRCRFAMR